MANHKNARNDLTAEYVRSILDYEPETGLFRWKRRPDYPTYWNTRFVGVIAGKTDPSGRVFIGINYTKYLAHRLAWLLQTGDWPEHEVDHTDGNAGNNRWSNLRQATSSENLCNRPAPRHNTSGYKGVSWSTRNNGWIARITKQGRIYHLGTFGTKEAAFAARVAAEHKLHGSFGKH